MACNIVWQKDGILFDHSGTVTSLEVMSMNDVMYGDVRFNKIRYQISDYTKVTENLVNKDDAKVIGTLDKASSKWQKKKMKLAVVTQDEAFIPSVEEYFRSLQGSGWEGRIFSTLDEAYVWVGNK